MKKGEFAKEGRKIDKAKEMRKEMETDEYGRKVQQQGKTRKRKKRKNE